VGSARARQIERLLVFVKKREVHWIWLAFALGVLGVFLKLTSELREKSQKLESIDHGIASWIHENRIPSWNGPAIDITALGSLSVLTILVLIGVLALLVSRNFALALQLALAGSGAGGWTTLLKQWLVRDRPPSSVHLVDVTGYSYPSGHSLSASAVYLTLAFVALSLAPNALTKITILSLTLALIVLVACSRIYLGVHYPSDVLSGVLLGAAWACALEGCFQALSHTKSTSK
jgi:undecaprenyl-diphosphatase